MLKNKTKVLNTKSWLIASKTTSTKESSFWQELAWVSHLEFLISVLQAPDFTANSPNTISHTLRPYSNWASTSRIQNHSWESPKSFYPVNTSRLWATSSSKSYKKKGFSQKISHKILTTSKRKQVSALKSWSKLMVIPDQLTALSICAKKKLQLRNGKSNWKSWSQWNAKAAKDWSNLTSYFLGNSYQKIFSKVQKLLRRLIWC